LIVPGHPSYKFNILKNIIPNNGIVDDDDDDLLDQLQKGEKTDSKDKKKRQAHNTEMAKEAKPEENSSKADDGDDKLINFDTSPVEETIEGGPIQQDGELIGGFDERSEASPGFGSYTEAKEDGEGIILFILLLIK
jgi:hypothetical protein